MTQLNDAQRQLQATARALADTTFAPRAAEIDRTEAYPWNNVEELVDAGFMGMTIPAEYGGRGLSYLSVVPVITQIARACGVTARIVVEANMGAIGAIMAYGTEAQKRRCAPMVLAGDKPAICITEPDAGSAATEMTTTAVKHGDHYILNGRKHWITGGGVSRLHLIFARVIDKGRDLGIGGFIAVRGEDEGLAVGAREPAMGLRGIPETEIVLKDLRIPLDMALFPSGGFASLMSAYNAQRVGAAAVAHGIAQGAYEHALDFARSREQFGRPIAEFQGLQWMLADMATQLAASEALILKAADCEGFPDMTEAAQAKLFASEMAIKVTNDALQIHGAKGYSRNAPLERMVRDARMFTIGGGTAQMLRNQIAGSILGMKTRQTRGAYTDATTPPLRAIG